MENNTIVLKPSLTLKKWQRILIEVGFALLAFLLPFFLLVGLFASCGFSPFVKNGLTLISFDMKSEYIAYFRYFQELLKGGDWIYTEGKVFGGDFLSIYTFYLASPFNLFMGLVSKEAIPDFILITTILKMSFAGLNFYLLCRFTQHKIAFSHYAFAVGYALVSYSFIYLSNYMWIDGVMILPLMVLGLNLLKESKVCYLYSISLAYSLISSWYIGFMTCVFSVFYFMYLFFSDAKSFKEKMPCFLRYVIYSLIGGFLGAICWLTAFLHFSGTKATQSFPKFDFGSLSMLLTGFLENNYMTTGNITQYFGYASMFTGMVSLVFFLRSFFNPGIKVRERISYGVLFFFYCLCILSTTLNALMHGGREPTWFPARFSYILGFLVCYFASKECEHRETSSNISSLVALLVPAVVLPIVVFTKNSNRFEPDSINAPYLYYSISWPSFIVYYLTAILSSLYPFLKRYPFGKKYEKWILSSVSLALVPLSCFSAYRGGKQVVSTDVKQNQFVSQEEYLEDDALTPVFEMMKGYNTQDCYRMEATFDRPNSYNETNNNPMFYGYNGLNHYSSSAKKDVEEFMLKLGFHYNYFFEKYDGGSTAAINSFLNLRYLIDDIRQRTDEPLFQKNTNEKNIYREITSLTSPIEGYKYYENIKPLSYGFFIGDSDYEYVGDGSRKEDGSVHYFDRFEFQNELFAQLAPNVVELDGTPKKIFKHIEFDNITYSSDDILHEIDGEKDLYTIKATESITFRFTVPEEARGNNLYFDEKVQNKYWNCYFDGKYYANNTYWHKGIRSFEDDSNHVHRLRFTAKQNFTRQELRPSVVYEDLDVLNEYLDQIRANQVNEIQKKIGFCSSSYFGKISVTEDNRNDSILFTIPYENNISILIDGKKQKVLRRVNIFSAVDLEDFALGEHSIEIRYTDKGLILGMILSVSAFAELILLSIYYPRIEQSIFTKKEN